MSTTIAITGGAGFLGSHVVDHFVENGERVVVLDNLSEGHLDNLSGSIDRPNCELRETDLLDREAAFDALADADVVVHLAAKIGGIGYFHDVPANIISKNDAMNQAVFDAAVEHDLDRVVYASSSMVYERAEEFPVTEAQVRELPPPESAYGFQKLSGEYYCEAYADQYDLEYTVFRPFNAVGPREPPGEEAGQAHVIPDFVKKIRDERQDPVRLLGDGTQVRAFTNVRDIARGVHRCVFAEQAANTAYNLGSSDGIRMRDLAERIWELCDRTGEIEFEFGDAFEHDVQRRVPDSSKARAELDWKPRIGLEDSLREYIDWYEGAV
jgi:nucleoside-diphosphate-sugar epimerase